MSRHALPCIDNHYHSRLARLSHPRVLLHRCHASRLRTTPIYSHVHRTIRNYLPPEIFLLGLAAPPLSLDNSLSLGSFYTPNGTVSPFPHGKRIPILLHSADDIHIPFPFPSTTLITSGKTPPPRTNSHLKWIPSTEQI